MSSIRSNREIHGALSKKGFHVEKDNDHVRYYHLDSQGKETGIKTKISHGALGATVSLKLISKMARQLHLTKSQFLALIDCPISEEDYRIILRKQGVEA